MTGLLVSVRDSAEARAALAAGVDLIDLKEPRRGALGPVNRQTIQDVLASISGRVPVSAALGELVDLDWDFLRTLPVGVALAKFGLAGCAQCDDWPARLADAVAALPHATAGVAVIYADADIAQSPPAEAIVEHAARMGCRAMLIDTFDKVAGALLDHWTIAECGAAIARIRAAEMLAVVGGSLDAAAITRLLPLSPDYVAVRGAACRPDRTGTIAPDLVVDLVATVRGTAVVGK